MDAISDPALPVVVCIKGSQVGWTEIINNVVGYHVHQDPAPMLIVQPTIELAEAWSKDRLAPMLRDTPALKGKVLDTRGRRESDNTIRQKIYAGGRLTIVGANAPSGLAARPIRIVLADETDRYPVSAGTEGDPLRLAAKRQQTFWNRKTLLGSTPVRKDTSIIWREWNNSDQRRYFVPCPDCGHAQHLQWANVKWHKDEAGAHQPHTAAYMCEGCGSLWDDVVRWDAIKHGHWAATGPDNGVAGFHIPGMLSPWLTLNEIVKEFLIARHDPSLLQVWVNTVLGEPWEDETEKIEGSGLVGRREQYGPEDMPDGVRLLTAGVDVQDNRLEATIVGWGNREESWVIQHAILLGDPAQPAVWSFLDKHLLRRFVTETGRMLHIRGVCVDTGGHHGNAVFEYCKLRRTRRYFPTKGIAGPRPIWPKRSSRAVNNNNVYLVGVDTGKDTLRGRLNIRKPGPGFIHFPVEEAIDQRYFDQLTSEQVVIRKKEGRPYRVWFLPSGKQNEALDCYVLALAARLTIPVRLDAFKELPLSPSVELEDQDDDQATETGATIIPRAGGTAPSPAGNEPIPLPNNASIMPEWNRPQPWVPRKDWFGR